MNRGERQMKSNRAAATVFYILLLLLALFLGYLWGYYNAPSGFQVTVAAPETSAVIESQEETEPQGPINLNDAEEEELIQLPGIGPAIAGRIVAYRQKHGPFNTIEEIMDVEGIGETRFNGIKDLISIGEVR